TPQRLVSREDGPEGLAREHANQEPRPGAGIAAVDHVLGLGEPVGSRAVDEIVARTFSRDFHAERPYRPEGGQAVRALQEPRDLRAAAGERAEQRGPMRDGLVAGHEHAAGKTRSR